ncbi:DUF4924 family protein [bacterium SCSIO 12741]|nr:DUF4924 family protein [bacterium SCSIO 12741]
MIIAEQKKKDNIIEYVLYMWNVEDLLRSFNLDLGMVEDKVIAQYDVDEKKKEEIRDWYVQLIKDMRENDILESGHLPDLNELITELNFLHQSLLHLYNDTIYQRLEKEAHENLLTLIEKSGKKNISPIEAGLNGLYGTLLLKMKQKQISEETAKSIKTISDLFAYLAVKYREMKAGKLVMSPHKNN